MRATLKEIAKRSGLSRPTVSEILGQKGHLYRAETRDKVLCVAKELGYQPNAYARGMAKGEFGAIGLLKSTDPSGGSVSGDVMCGIEQTALREDLHLVLGHLPDSKLTDEGVVPRLLSEWSVDGMLINYTSHIPEKMMELIGKYRLPSIWMNVKLPNDCVYVDDLGALSTATRRLLELGHRRIAYLGFSKSDHYSVQDRRDGYLSAMHQAGLAGQVFWEEGLVQRQWISATLEMLRRPGRPTAFVTYSEDEALVLMMAAAHAGLRFPADLSLIATREGHGSICGVDVSTIELPGYEMGRRAFEMLQQKIKSPTRVCEAQPLSFDSYTGATCAAPVT